MSNHSTRPTQLLTSGMTRRQIVEAIRRRLAGRGFVHIKRRHVIGCGPPSELIR